MTVRAMGPIKFFNPEPRESSLERWFVGQVKKLGGKAFKFTSPGHRSVPDRIVIFPYEHIFLVELKRKGKHSTPKQKDEQNFWFDYGFAVYVADSKEACMAVLKAERVL
jgi:hypothetical protein